jgi:hypothetical protein
MTNQIPNFIRPEEINEILNADVAFETPGARATVRFPTGVRPFGMMAGHTVLVESTPDGDWWRRPTNEESLAAWRAKREVECDAERALIAEHAQLMATATGLRRAVLEIHCPDEYGLCQGCETDCCAPKLSDCTTYALARGWPE